jgi:L-alanine-DL-glutamate epimerase-like enolase superfamily enzyme
VVEIEGGGQVGLGYTYSAACIVDLIRNTLAVTLKGKDALAPQHAFAAMRRAVRNLGREGLAGTAVSAVDAALHDLKARLLDLPLVRLLGARRSSIPIYGSGGFTTYSDRELEEQLGGWVAKDGCAFVKMKIGSQPERDPHRVAVAKAAIDNATLFVDANGAYGPKQALSLANRFAEQNVAWFEEPVSSDDLSGLAMVRKRAPAGVEVAAGEYAYTSDYVRNMLEAGAVDVQQADATRCGGFTGFLQIAAVCDAFHVDLSGHCAPALHLHAACAAPRLRHLEWFHDHVRIERMLFDGAPQPRNGEIAPDLSRPGNGLAFKRQDAARYAVAGAS